MHTVFCDFQEYPPNTSIPTQTSDVKFAPCMFCQEAPKVSGEGPGMSMIKGGRLHGIQKSVGTQN